MDLRPLDRNYGIPQLAPVEQVYRYVRWLYARGFKSLGGLGAGEEAIESWSAFLEDDWREE